MMFIHARTGRIQINTRLHNSNLVFIRRIQLVCETQRSEACQPRRGRVLRREWGRWRGCSGEIHEKGVWRWFALEGVWGGERALCLLIGGRCNTCNESASAGCGFPLMSEHPSCPWKERNNNNKKKLLVGRYLLSALPRISRGSVTHGLGGVSGEVGRENVCAPPSHSNLLLLTCQERLGMSRKKKTSTRGRWESRGRYRDEVNGKVDVSNIITPLGVAVFALKQNKQAPCSCSRLWSSKLSIQRGNKPGWKRIRPSSKWLDKSRMLQPMGGALGISLCCDFQVSVRIEWRTFVIVCLRSDGILAWRRRQSQILITSNVRKKGNWKFTDRRRSRSTSVNTAFCCSCPVV